MEYKRCHCCNSKFKWIYSWVKSRDGTISYALVAGGCTTTSTRTVTVTAPLQPGTLSGNQNICVGGTSAFASTITGGGWSSADPAIATVDPVSGLVSGIAAGTTNITYSIAASGGCPGVSAKRTITVTAAPNAGTLSGNQSICINNTTTFSSTSPGGAWTSGNTAIASVDANTGIVTGKSPGTATITYTATGSGGCADALATRTVTVSQPLPAGTLSGMQTICVTANTTFSSTIAGGTWASSNALIASVDAATGVVTGASPGTTDIIYTGPTVGGCASSSASRSVTVIALPVLSGSGVVCVGLPTSFAVSGIQGGTWSIANTGIASNAGVVGSTITLIGVSAGTTAVTYTAVGGCIASRDLKVTVAPGAGTLSGVQSICVAATSNFSSTASGGSWLSSNDAVATVDATSGVVTGVSAGTAIITYTVKAEGGCADATASRAITVNATTSLTITQVSCDSYTWPANGQTYTESGTFYYSGTNGSGCNLAKTLVLTINKSSSNTTTKIACDSYTWPVNGETYSESGTYTATTLNSSGCTLTEILNLTVNKTSPIVETKVACDSYTWNITGETYGISGTYYGSAVNASGCTQQYTLQLTINYSTGNTTEVTSCDNYTWPVNGVTYISSGDYTVTSVNAAGCTHTEILHLTINYSTIRVSEIIACDSYTWYLNGQEYTSSGTYSIVTSNTSGCTHTEKLQLTINKSTSHTSTVTACDSYFWCVNSTMYTESGTYTVITTNAGGCTNTETLQLTINKSSSTSTTAVACNSYTWAANGNTYNESGTYTFVSLSPEGCTQTQILNLVINTGTTNHTTISACGTYTWPVNGQTYTASGSYSATVISASGCTNTEILDLTITEAASAGIVTGNGFLCKGSTAAFTSDGTAGGTWISTNPAVAAVDASTGLVTAIAAGDCNIVYKVTGCGGIVTASASIVVSDGASSITVTGQTPLCVGASASYSYIGPDGGSWLSTNQSVATVNATGVVTAIANGTTEIKYTAAGCNTTVSGSFSLTVNSPQTPVTCPPGAPFTRLVNGTCNYTVLGKEFDATVNSSCTAPVLTYNLAGATTGSGSSLAGVVLNEGVTTITWTATNGNATNTCSFTVTIKNTSAPVIICPTSLTQGAGGTACSKSVAVANPTISDDCGVASVSWVMTGATSASSPATGINYVGSHTFNVGTTNITYTAKDVSGNIATCSFTVTITNNRCSTSLSTKKEIGLASTSGDLIVEASPNPSESFFTLKLKSTSKEMVTIKVFDMQGKLMNTIQGAPTKQFRLGDNYIGGMYMVEVIQNDVHKQLKLVKQ